MTLLLMALVFPSPVLVEGIKCPAQVPAQMVTQCTKASPCFEGIGCDAKSGLFISAQCVKSGMCAACYPDSACRNATKTVDGKTASGAAGDDGKSSSSVPLDLAACMANVTNKTNSTAQALAGKFVKFNENNSSSAVHKMSQCGFQRLLDLAPLQEDQDTSTPIHLVILFKTTEPDTSIVKLLRTAAKTVGGEVVLRNRVFVPVVDISFVTILGFASPKKLVSFFQSPEFAEAVLPKMLQEFSTLSMSLMRLNIDVRVPVTDCAYDKDWGFDATKPLPWPEKAGLEQQNQVFMTQDTGKLANNLIFNKALSKEKASKATFDYIDGVRKATFKHGFKPHMAFTCMWQAATGETAEFCRSVQLVGDTLMGYDTFRVVEYPSRRAMLSMMNDESWIIADKQDEWEWNVGVPTEPIYEDLAEIADIPQTITPSFKGLTGFDHKATQCTVAVRQAQRRTEIIKYSCFEKSSGVNMEKIGGPCSSLFENPIIDVAGGASCPTAECQSLMNELQPCFAGFWNTYDAGDALVLSAMKSGGPQAKAAAKSLSPSAWFLEVERRGCPAKNITLTETEKEVEQKKHVVTVTMKVEKLDYDKLLENADVLKAFKEKCQESVAKSAGIEDKNKVKIKVFKGSVIVEATVPVEGNDDENALKSKLLDVKAADQLTSDVKSLGSQIEQVLEAGASLADVKAGKAELLVTNNSQQTSALTVTGGSLGGARVSWARYLRAIAFIWWGCSFGFGGSMDPWRTSR
jgi:hypothetical protein